MTAPGRPKGYAPDSPTVRAQRRRPRRLFGASPGMLADRDLRPLLPMKPPHDTNPPLPDVLDQLQTDSCVAHAIPQGVRCLASKQALPPVLMSRLGLYYEARATLGEQGQDGGTLPSAAFGAIDAYGMADESAWPFDPAQVLTPPPPEVYRSGWDSRGALLISAITDVPGQREAEIRTHLNEGHPVTLGLMIDDAFEQGTVPLWTAGGGPVLGGHYVLGLASRADGLFVLSSWGVGFGELGGIWVAWSTIEDPSVCLDLVALEQLLKWPGS